MQIDEAHLQRARLIHARKYYPAPEMSYFASTR